jgi:hypothetical protein
VYREQFGGKRLPEGGRGEGLYDNVTAGQSAVVRRTATAALQEELPQSMTRKARAIPAGTSKQRAKGY